MSFDESPRRGWVPAIASVAGWFVVLCGATPALSQDLEPRAYSSSPVGTNFVAIVAGSTRGAILFDPTLPISDASAGLRLVTVGYGRTFAVGNRQALVVLVVPYAWGYAEGLVQEETQSVRRAGFGDLRARVSVNLLGPKAMGVEEFRKAARKTVLGVSLTVQAPTGEYDETKLINLGTNRFALKPEIGISIPVGRWYVDGYAGAWFFETNEKFYPGEAVRRQDPLTVVQAHASYTFTNHAWIAIDATWYGGGQATVGSGAPSTRQSNTRLGATVSVPIASGQSLKFAASTGTTARTGTDFDSILVGWQFTWFDRPRDGRP